MKLKYRLNITNSTKRRICFAALLLVLSVVQNIEGFFPSIFGIRALFLVPAVVCVAMQERDVYGMFLGLFAGALWDISADGGSFNAIFLTIVGFACGALINSIMRNNVVTAGLLSGIALTAHTLVYWLINCVFDGYDKLFFILMRYYVPGIVYSIVFTPVLFMLVRKICAAFDSGKNVNLQ